MCAQLFPPLCARNVVAFSKFSITEFFVCFQSPVQCKRGAFCSWSKSKQGIVGPSMFAKFTKLAVHFSNCKKVVVL